MVDDRGILDKTVEQVSVTMQASKPRLFYLDNLKVLLIVLVVMHHAGQPYGPGGDWPIAPEPLSEINLLVMSLFFVVNSAFFMGLFFMISAYFLPGSFDRKGPAQFVNDRLIRLGVPTIVGVLGIIPVMVYLLGTQGMSFFDFYLNNLDDLSLGWLWFLAMLLVFAVCYVALRMASKSTKPKVTGFPGTASILAFAGVMALLTFAVRIMSPINEWTWFHIFEPAHLPQYAMLFAAGIVAYRGGWLDKIPAATAKTWSAVAGLMVLAVPVIYFTLGDAGFDGGLSPMALLWSAWECLLCVSMCIGLLALFKNRFSSQGRIVKAMADNAFTVYLIHIPVIIFLQYLLVGVAIDPMLKFLIVSAVAIPACFGIGHFVIRRLPIVKNVL
jgi:peptidoglycan/LPS O-acetylase OafA/YrhL